jgi:diguanylate cyclase (GGDEF)-like protein
MRFDFKTRVFAAYVIVLVLGAVLATMVYHYGNAILGASRVLTERDVPLLHDISTLQLVTQGLENDLYEYYATQDQRSFLTSTAQHRNNAAHLLGALRAQTILPPHRQTLEVQYSQLDALTDQFDRVMSAAEVDWDRARSLLKQISTTTIEINRLLTGIRAQVRAGIDRSGMATEMAINRTRTLVLALSMAIFMISLFAGYHTNAYMTDQAERRRLAAFPERNPNPVLRLSLDGQVMFANPGAAELLRLVGENAGDTVALLPPDFRQRLAVARETSRSYDIREYPVGHRTLECGIHFLPDLECFHVYISDITERKRAQEDLVFQAYHDALTGLPNRRLFQEQLTRTLHAPGRDGMRAAVLLLGVDRLNIIIDGLGHSTSDKLLQEAATRLTHILDRNTRFARDPTLYCFGGEIFALLIPGFKTGNMPIRMAEQINGAMCEPLHVNAREFFLTFSIGISVFPLDGQDAMTLLRNADTAMNSARELGGNTLQCYSEDMNARVAERLTLENHLRHAQEHDELRLYYHAQVDIRNDRLIGMEALLRWEHPQRGLILPAEFIPLAEESSTMITIGEWVLRTACTRNKTWHEAGFGELVVAVNISAHQFHQQDLPEVVARTLHETDLPANQLELEITESIAMQDAHRTTDTLRQLKDMGVRLSIDDFGTGFSSLSYLKGFPIDKLKIDQSFVHNLVSDEDDAAITRAVITLGHSLKLKVIAEGVETEAQLAQLRRDGCDAVQGYLYGEPVPADEFAHLFRGRVLNIAANSL